MLVRSTMCCSELRAQIRRLGRDDESACVSALLAQGGVPLAQRQQVEPRAASLVQAIRRRQHYGADINGLLNEYSLPSQEGVLLMCLAEALLRVPGPLTADRLIADKFGSGDWQTHLGHGGSLFVNASAWGLLLAGKAIGLQQAGPANGRCSA